MTRKPYCTQNGGDCRTCSLTNYGRDCANNPLPQVARLQTKYERVKALAPMGKYHKTFDAIWNGIPRELKDQLTSKQLALVVATKAQSFADGKASAGAELVDDNAVWINKLNRAIEWVTVDGNLVARFAE